MKGYLRALLGQVIEGEPDVMYGVIAVALSRNEVLVQTGNGVFRARNYRLPSRVGLPVVIQRVANGWEVTGVDNLVMPDMGNYHYVPWHHEAHEFGHASGGDDVVWLGKQQYTPLLVAPTNPPSLFVRVFPSTYIAADLTVREVVTPRLLDLSPYYGAYTVTALIVLNLETGDPDVAIFESTPTVPIGSVPLALVRLRPGATEIGWEDILDIRELPPTLAAVTLARVEEIASQFRSIRRISASGMVTLYDATDAGLLSALSEATSGDRIITPTASFTANVTVPSGVVLDFSNSFYSGTISGSGVVKNFQQ